MSIEMFKAHVVAALIEHFKDQKLRFDEHEVQAAFHEGHAGFFVKLADDREYEVLLAISP